MTITLRKKPKTKQGDPDGQNLDRAEWALRALEAFQQATRTDNEDALSDLLCDLMHLADYAKGGLEEFDSALARAEAHYGYETEAEEEEN